jgi:hypothetical protein
VPEPEAKTTIFFKRLLDFALPDWAENIANVWVE